MPLAVKSLSTPLRVLCPCSFSVIVVFFPKIDDGRKITNETCKSNLGFAGNLGVENCTMLFEKKIIFFSFLFEISEN